MTTPCNPVHHFFRATKLNIESCNCSSYETFKFFIDRKMDRVTNLLPTAVKVLGNVCYFFQRMKVIRLATNNIVSCEQTATELEEEDILVESVCRILHFSPIIYRTVKMLGYPLYDSERILDKIQ